MAFSLRVSKEIIVVFSCISVYKCCCFFWYRFRKRYHVFPFFFFSPVYQKCYSVLEYASPSLLPILSYSLSYLTLSLSLSLYLFLFYLSISYPIPPSYTFVTMLELLLLVHLVQYILQQSLKLTLMEGQYQQYYLSQRIAYYLKLWFYKC